MEKKSSEVIAHLESYKTNQIKTYKRHQWRRNKFSWIVTNDGVSADEQATGDDDCEIPSADFTPKADTAVFTPITPAPKDRACRRSLTSDDKNSNLKRKARNDAMLDESETVASDVDVLCIDDPEKDIRRVYRRRKKVQNRTPNKATRISSLPDELKAGPNGEGGKEVVEDSECNGESVEDQRKWPESEESPLLKKIRLFMSRMDCVIGERKFSEWRGSVMDSIVGAYLTQNVSDVLSSSAFMSLAAKFPQEGVRVNSHGETSSSQVFDTWISRRHTIKNKHDAELMNALKESHARYHSERRMVESVDVINWSSVMKAKEGEISKAIQRRGMNKNLAKRIKHCLNHLVKTFGSTDMEWMRHLSCDEAKNYLRGIHGLGLKSVKCIRLLTLLHKAFPIDRNAGRVATRLGWIPIEKLPKVKSFSKKMNLLQEYLWAHVLAQLEHSLLYELHCQIITFGKVFCKESNPNCSACPMRAECKYIASLEASATVGDIEDYPRITRRNRSHAPRMASIPVVKKKEDVTSSRIELQVYVLPKNHELLAEQESRVFYDQGPHLLAVWNSESLEKDECIHEEDAIYGTLLISARAANRGAFPLNGTYFQYNEVFADEESSKVPIKVWSASVKNLSCTTLYCGKNMSSICKGMTNDEVQELFKRGYTCFRGFNTKTREPTPLPERFHAQVSKAAKTNKRNKK